MVEQSERPSGPYLLDDIRLHELVDFQNSAARIQRTDDAAAGSEWWLTQPAQAQRVEIVRNDVATVAIGGGSPTYAGGTDIAALRDREALGPERLLSTAAADHPHALPDTMLNGVPHHVVEFSWDGVACTLFINATTDLPSKVTWTEAYPYQLFLNAWGDVTSTLTFSAWSLEPNGLHFPREWTYERLGLPDAQLFFTQVAFNVAAAPAGFSIPQDIYDAHHGQLRALSQRPFPTGESVTKLAHGVELAASSWNVAFVDQPDGVVVVEAPIDPNYAKQAFAYARKRFHKPVKALVTTSDAWPHIAGVRQAVVENIPIYALDLNIAILKRIVAAPHRLHPDDLARADRAPVFHSVSAATTVGTGANRLVVIPYRTATAEREMYVWLPGRSLLYSSDLFAPHNGGGWFTPQYLDEAIAAYKRDGINPTTLWGMHYGPTPYATIVKALGVFLHGNKGAVFEDGNGAANVQGGRHLSISGES